MAEKRREPADPEISLAASALQKSIRLGAKELAVGWGLWLWQREPYYVWKHLLVCACEDIGMANPDFISRSATEVIVAAPPGDTAEPGRLAGMLSALSAVVAGRL